jgi:hypothetical protein
MAAKATTAARAPRGTKTLTAAFFAAAKDVPDNQRDVVVKAALAAISDQLKDDRLQAKAANARAKMKSGKVASSLTAKKPPVVAAKRRKATARRAPKVSPRSPSKPEAA